MYRRRNRAREAGVNGVAYLLGSGEEISFRAMWRGVVRADGRATPCFRYVV